MLFLLSEGMALRSHASPELGALLQVTGLCLWDSGIILSLFWCLVSEMSALVLTDHKMHRDWLTLVTALDPSRVP